MPHPIDDEIDAAFGRLTVAVAAFRDPQEALNEAVIRWFIGEKPVTPLDFRRVSRNAAAAAEAARSLVPALAELSAAFNDVSRALALAGALPPHEEA